VKRIDEPTRDGWLIFQSTEGAETTDFGALPRYLEAKRGAVKVPEALASKLNHLIDLARHVMRSFLPASWRTHRRSEQWFDGVAGQKVLLLVRG